MASFLTAALVLSAAPALPESYETLRSQCLFYAAEPRNPWAMAHGITAFGSTFAASDGRVAAEVILSDFLRKSPDAASTPYSFARYDDDGTPIEPHTNLIVKTLVLANVPPSRNFKTPFGTVSLAGLVEGVKKGFVHAKTQEDYWRDVGWTLDLLAATLRPGPSAVFRNALGQSVDFNGVMEDALAYVEKVQLELAQGVEKGLPQVDKRKQGIYAHTCGGLHLIQAVNHWARHPLVKKAWKTRLEKQTAILFYRLESEARQYEAAQQKAPQYRLQILTQKVKFYGHFLETTGRMKKEMGFVPTSPQRQAIEKAKALLDDAVSQLRQMSAFESMETLKKNHRQVYLDLIGDSCHAVNGWNLWR